MKQQTELEKYFEAFEFQRELYTLLHFLEKGTLPPALRSRISYQCVKRNLWRRKASVPKKGGDYQAPRSPNFMIAFASRSAPFSQFTCNADSTELPLAVAMA